MTNPYERCPVYENEAYLLRLVSLSDAPSLLLVYSDKKALPFFNSDNCHGDNFYYPTLKRMEEAIEFWQREYRNKGFVRWVIIDKRLKFAIGTIELFNRQAKDYFHNCGLLRLDVRSDYEHTDTIFSLFSLIVPPAFLLFQCQMIATKIPPFAFARKAAAEKLGFTLSPEPLMGANNQTAYTDYYVIFQKNPSL